MDDRFNTIAGWALAGGIAALGLSIVSGMVFHSERPEKMGYAIEGVEDTSEGGGAAVAPIATRLAAADVAKGADIFKQCTACHTINQGGASGIGPNLYAAVGKPHGHVPGFAYSDALKAVPGTWTFEALDSWLTSPRKYAPGTKMTFAGLSNPQDRANVIAYLNSQGSNLPLPAASAAGEEPAAGNAAEANVAEGAGTANVSNEATPAEGTPAKDPQAAIQAEKKGH
ncbi:c-type cytochrome [Sphingomonas sp. Root241]|uniref:c-type cytochrome n=1 Tax=Sphingomonas sp. Root241 TaxID=1736501 RepID=UPI0006FD48A5|nr:cytochrome c family protein [Sphingomonas sp. Root241]KRC79742.1 cytochrome C [Sphingomonas sp. Root241]